MQEESRAASTHLNNLWGNLLDNEANPEELRQEGEGPSPHGMV